MSVKLIGTVIIMITFSAAGFRMSEKIKQREESLRIILHMINRISSLIEYSSAHVCDILKVLAEDETLNKLSFIERAETYYENGRSFEKSWKKAIYEDSVIGESERERLIMLGSSLGKSGRKDQLNMLKLHSDSISEQIKLNAEDFMNKRKLFTSLGILTGAMVSVLLI